MNCPHCEQAIGQEDSICPHCQIMLSGEPSTPNPFASPIVQAESVPGDQPNQSEGDATGGVIPYKNPRALTAYYLGIVSGLPLIGLPFGIAAFVLGIQGLKARKKKPAIKGSAHAWVGIGCGGIFTLLWAILIIAMIVATLAG